MSTHAHAEAVPAREELALYLASLSFVAGVIHVVASVEHFDHIWWYGASFAVLATFQFAWGLRAFRGATRGVLLVGAAVSAAVVAIWVVSRTLGVPFGPEAWDPEAIGAIDAASVVDELVIVGFVAALLRSRLPVAFSSAGRFAIYAVLTLTSLSLFVGGAHHH